MYKKPNCHATGIRLTLQGDFDDYWICDFDRTANFVVRKSDYRLVYGALQYPTFTTLEDRLLYFVDAEIDIN